MRSSRFGRMIEPRESPKKYLTYSRIGEDGDHRLERGKPKEFSEAPASTKRPRKREVCGLPLRPAARGNLDDFLRNTCGCLHIYI